MYKNGFFIKDNLGNNAFSYFERKKIGNNKIYIPKLINGKIEDIKIGKNISFEEMDKNGNLQSCKGLENFVYLENKNIYVFDNHNHALYFWYQEFLKNKKKFTSLIHIDQHTDMNKNNFEPKSKSLEDIFEYVNYFTNVGNFIRPGKKLGLFDNILQINTEHKLLNYDFRNMKDYIIDIDLDFWDKNMSIYDINLTIDITKKLIQNSKLATIATSPYFIEQSDAIEILKKILG